MKTVYIFTIWLCWTFISCGNPDDHRLDKNSEVYIKKTDSGYVFIRDGKGFRIKGASGNGYLQELKDAGGNTIRIYDPSLLPEIFEESEKFELAVIADIPLPKSIHTEYYTDDDKFNQIKKEVTALVEKYKNRKTLLYWNLGNELYYPDLFEGDEFVEKFNELIDLIHQLDPNHPVSTSIVGGNRERLLSISKRSPEIDFLSFNSFGNLPLMQDKFNSISLLWEGPFVITEWGIHGPWEAINTSWDAPMELTSKKKADSIQQIYQKYVKDLNAEFNLGNLYFFWGDKHEGTETWFNVFSKDGKPTETYSSLKNIWNENSLIASKPYISYLSLNDQPNSKRIILEPSSKNTLKVTYENPNKSSLNFRYELKEESWENVELPGKTIEIWDRNEHQLTFDAPAKDGPYRIYVWISSENKGISTANLPFYVLNPGDEL